MSLPYPTDPSLPANPTPLFSDTAAARGDHLRANNAEIWSNFSSLESSKIEVLTSSVDSDIALFDGITGKILKDSGVKISTDGTFSSIVDTLIPSVKATYTQILSRIASLRESFGSISNNVGTPNSIMDFGVGKHWSDDSTEWIADVVGMSKTSSSWAAGTGNGMLDTGTFAASKVYYFYRILNPTTSAVDYLMSLSSTSPTMPTGYTKKRIIGAALTNASTQFIPSKFSRPTVDLFQCIYKTVIADRPGAAAGNVNRNLLTVSAPIGSMVKMIVKLQANTAQSTNTEFLQVGSTFEADVGSSNINSCAACYDSAVAGVYGLAQAEPTAIVDSNQQIFWKISAMSQSIVGISTKSWQLSL